MYYLRGERGHESSAGTGEVKRTARLREGQSNGESRCILLNEL